MAIPAVPVIGDLPPAPTRNDGAADFTPKADAMIGALQPLVVQVNIALQWMNGRLTDTQAAQAAAAVSATAAAGSATLAGQKAVLADTARQGAEAARASSEVLAAAVQAAAGTPSLAGNKNKVLTVNPDELTVTWKNVGQQIGDTLIAARNPGITYLKEDGSIYLKSSYPLLSPLLGSIGGTYATGFATQTLPSFPDTFKVLAVAADNLGNWIIGSGSRNTAVSSNDGVSWAAGADIPSFDGGIVAITSDNKGMWLAISAVGGVFKSTDNGASWTRIRNSGGVTGANSITTDGGGTWVITEGNAVSTNILRSSDNGITWNAVAVGSGATLNSVATNGAGVWIGGGAPASLTQTIYKSTDNALTWTLVPSATVGFANTARPVLAAVYSRGVFILMSDASTLNARRSSDNGLTWFDAGSGNTTTHKVMTADGQGTVVMAGTSGVLLRSADDGFSWKAGASAVSADITQVKCSGKNTWITASTGTYVISRSVAVYPYDIATQFKVRTASPAIGALSYMKAKEDV